MTSSNTTKKKNNPHPDKCLVNEQTAHSYIMIPLSPTARFKQAVKKEPGVLSKHLYIPQNKKKKEKDGTAGPFYNLFFFYICAFTYYILIRKLVLF